MKPILLVQLSLLLLAGAFITYHFVAFPTTLLLVMVGASVVLGNGALFVKIKQSMEQQHSSY